jgi:hypothetical protein
MLLALVPAVVGILGALLLWAEWSPRLQHKGAMIFQVCTLVAVVSFVLYHALIDRLGHPVRTSTIWRYRFRSDAELKIKNADYLKVLTAAHVRPGTAPVSATSLEVRFPLPPKRLKEQERR